MKNSPIGRIMSAPFVVLFFAAIFLPASIGAQTLSVTPTSVSVQANAGTNAPSQTVQVRKTGAGALKWSVVPNGGWPSWLSVSPTSGTNNVALILTFNTASLPAGTYPSSPPFSFTVQAGQQSVAVAVTLTIVGSAPPPPPPLTVTCPANTSVASPDGNPVVVNYGTATASGGVPPYTYSYTRSDGQSGTSFPVGVTTITATATDSQPTSKQCQFTVTINYTPPPPPSVDISVSPTTTTPGSSVTVSYSNPNPTSTDWIALSPAGPSLQTYSDWKYAGSCTRTPGAAIASGSCPFTVPSTPGTYEFWLLANNQYTVLDTVTVTVTSPTPPPPSTGVGPQPTITCPAGAVDIVPGPGTTIPYIQSLIDNFPGTTTFCFRAGVVTVDRSITPKTGNTFVGEYGAILDGTGWTTSDDSMAAFRAHNQDIDYVTIRNLVIRNLRRGINAYGTLSDHWTIDHNEIGPNYSGVVFSSYSVVTNNNIHHNSYIGYFGDHASYSTLENNEIAYNGWDQKVATSVNVTFRNNFIHHNAGGGIWYDSDNTGALVEGNRVEDNGWIGIFYEISGDGIIRNNTIRRNGDAGVFLGTSKNTQIYNNTFENNFRGITFFVNCAVVGGGTLPGGYDLMNNTAHDNTIIVGTQSGVFASSFSYYGVCTPTQTAPYLNGSKNLTFSNNTYHVPLPTTGQYWLWGETFKYWNEWQAIPQDLTSTVSQ